MIRLWILLLSVTVITGKLLPVTKYIYKERVIVGHFHHQLRQRRSETTNPNLFPDNIRVTFHLKGTLVDLNLTRKEHPNRHIIQDGKYTYRSSENINHQDHALYQNKTNGAAITMRCPHFDYVECDLHGVFVHKKGMFHIAPVEGEQKTLYEINEISYKGSRSAKVFTSAEYVLKQKMMRQENNKTSVNERTKRDASTPGAYVVEMALWFDYTMWQQFMALNNQDAVAAEADLNVYAVGIMNEVDVRFQNLQTKITEYGFSFSFDCNCMLNYVRICKDPSQCLWSTNAQVNGVITATTDTTIVAFINEIGSVPIGYDMISGVTLYECRDTKGINDEVIGIYYYRDTICVSAGSKYVASIINAENGAAGFNLAHFFMYHVGAYGDSRDTNCSEADNFIHSKSWSITTNESLATHPFMWSYCSIQRLKNKLDTTGVACLQDNNFDQALYAQYHTSALLGEVYDLDKQCSLETGTNTSVFCGTRQPNICYNGLSCTDPNAGGACVASAVFPYSGTRCDVEGTYPTKFCQNGTCVDGPKSTYYSCNLVETCVDDSGSLTVNLNDTTTNDQNNNTILIPLHNDTLFNPFAN